MPPFVLVIPEFALYREGAQALLADPSTDLRGLHVDLDGSRAIVPRPAFLDELVKEILGKRGAESLCLVSIDAGSAFFLRSSAERRGVSARILENRPISARKILLRRFLRRSSPVRY